MQEDPQAGRLDPQDIHASKWAKEAANKRIARFCRQPSRPWVLAGGGGRGRVREVAGGEVTAGPRSKATAAVVDGFGECWREREGWMHEAMRCTAMRCDAKCDARVDHKGMESHPVCSLCVVVSCVCCRVKSKKGVGFGGGGGSCSK